MTARFRRYELIVFDWDGTLADSTAVIVSSIQAACRDMGLAVPDDRTAGYVIGMGLAEAIAHVAPALSEREFPRLGSLYRHHYFDLHDQVKLFPGTVDMLDDLRACQHRIAIATGKSRRGLEAALELANVRDKFDGTRTADETAAKPDPLMLTELMSEFDVTPQSTLMVGDTTHDLQLAANAGTDAVAVTYGAHATSEFDGYQPCRIVHSTGELRLWLLENG